MSSFYKGDWQRVFPAEGFSPQALSSLPHSHDGPPRRVIVDRSMSVSFIAALPLAQQEIVRAQLQVVIDHTARAGRAGGDQFSLSDAGLQLHAHGVTGEPVWRQDG
jgi:hypothetical protein